MPSLSAASSAVPHAADSQYDIAGSSAAIRGAAPTAGNEAVFTPVAQYAQGSEFTKHVARARRMATAAGWAAQDGLHGAAQPGLVHLRSARDAQQLHAPAPNTTYWFKSNRFTTDSQGRIAQASGRIRLEMPVSPAARDTDPVTTPLDLLPQEAVASTDWVTQRASLVGLFHGHADGFRHEVDIHADFAHGQGAPVLRLEYNADEQGRRVMPAPGVPLPPVTAGAKPHVHLRTANDVNRLTQLRADTVYWYKNNRYETDSSGRIASASGALRHEGGERRGENDFKIGELGRPTDIGFHLIGSRFKGAWGPLNLVPGDRDLNTGAWWAQEQYLADAHDGAVDGQRHQVEIDVRPSYPDPRTPRPDKFEMRYRIDEGDWRARVFANEPPSARADR